MNNTKTQSKKTAKAKKETPLMKQYNSIKAKHPDAVLLFRVGDFYETFGQDAVRAANILGIVLTKRNNGGADIELAGFPHHSLDVYLPKLVRAGCRVAICEQLEDPKKTKKIVKRGVTEMVSPGVAINDQILDFKQNNYLAALFFEKENIGIAFIDVSTGEFLISQGNAEYIDKLLQSFQPKEILFSKNQQKLFVENFGNTFYTHNLEDWILSEDFAQEKLLNHFQVNSLKGFGVSDLNLALIAAGAILHHLNENQFTQLSQVTAINKIAADNYVWLDRFTIRNLELVNSNHTDGTALLQVLDQTVNPLGSRLLYKWLLLPLKSPLEINKRLNAVEQFIKQPELNQNLRNSIKNIGDLERLITKVVVKKANPRELLQLMESLKIIAKIQLNLAGTAIESFKTFANKLDPLPDLVSKIENTIDAECPVLVQKGNVIKAGVSAELDEFRELSTNGKNKLLEIQQTEIEKTGINSLKIGFNNVFGYYLEVRNTYKDKVPEEWVRKQTLTSAERYITDELKHYEEKILNAQEKIGELEMQLYQKLLDELSVYVLAVQKNAATIAQLDVLLSFAHSAVKFNYTKPTVDESFTIEIKGGRHPVIEKQLPLGEQYIANDVFLDNETQQLILITGPNMSGKSALLRQTALICLMAQMGSFVPAEKTQIGFLDRIFTRVGASDNISSGESTFMVEMNETASIVNNISQRSLILLDEIGRGTSTYDGISIAWSLAQFLHNNTTANPKTLFATHYHELTELTKYFDRIKNYSISTKVVGNKVIFLRKLIPEPAKKSFGIHVAQMAGMPKAIIDQANKILAQLESKKIDDDLETVLNNNAKEDYQLSIFQMDDPLLLQCKEVLQNLDINTLTPVEALMKLSELQKMLFGK